MLFVRAHEKVFDIYHADYIVPVVLINRYPGISVVAEYGSYFIIGRVDIHLCHIYTRRHDVLCPGIPEVHDIIYHHTLLGLYDPVLMTHIDNRPELSLGHYCLRIMHVYPEELQHAAAYQIHDKYHRCKDRHERVYYAGIKKRQPVRLYRRGILGSDLSEYQYDKSKDQSHDPHVEADRHRNGRRKCGCCNIYYIIAYKNG